MARADLILTLIKASRQGDDQQVRKTVEALAAEERAKNHTILADRLLAQLQSDNGRRGQAAPLLSRSAAGPPVTETVPARDLADLILPAEAGETMRELVAEQHRADLLRSYGLELPSPTQRQIEEWFRRFEKRHRQPLGLPPRSLAQRLRGLSFAEVEDFGTDVLRKIALGQPDSDINAIVERRLRHWKKRYTLKRPGESTDGAAS